MQKGTHSYLSDPRNKNVKIFINGKIYSRKKAKISVFDSGFLLGDGVWEGIRLLNGKLVFLDKHLDRLFYGAKKLSINIGCQPKELVSFIQDTIDINKMTTGVHIRIIVSRGLKITPYQHPNANLGSCSIVIIPEYKIPNKKLNIKGIKLATVTTQRGTAYNQDPKLNTLSKQNCISACIEADRVGADEGIMLDVNGNVSTCNSTNFFMIKNSEIWTSTGEYCLPGITRQTIINLCINNDISVFEKNFLIDDVHRADEAFVTGTFGGVIPAINIDSIKISEGRRGKMTHNVQKLYSNFLNKMYPIISHD